MQLAKILYLAEPSGEHPKVLATLERESARAGLPVEWQQVGCRDEALRALREPGVEALVATQAGWGAEALEALGSDVDAPPLILLGLRGESRLAASWVAAGVLDVVPIGEPWRIVPALRHAMARYERARMAVEKQRRVALVDIVEQLSLARSIDEVTGIVSRAARTLTQADGAAFVLREGDESHYVDEDTAEPTWKGRRFPVGRCICGWAMLNHRVAVIEDIYADLRIPIDLYAATPVKSLVAVPVRTASPVGAIVAHWSQERRASGDEIELLQALADTASIALDNVRATSELEARLRDRTRELHAAHAELEAARFASTPGAGR